MLAQKNKMEFIAKALHDYVVAHSQEEPPLLKKLTRETHLKVLQPRMLSGPLQGRFLSLLSKLIQPKNSSYVQRMGERI